jgi:large subunit ribosomal protein L21
MYVVLDIAGKQFRVKEKDYIYVPKLDYEVGAYLSNVNVLLAHDKETFKLGSSILSDVEVKCKVIDHLKDEKVIVFKKKRRKGYRKKQGHRQMYTKVLVEKIS